jgi:NAD(P)-dependent dehydrogenase (short-subunit alcohol dehydrogenase family)
VAHRQELAALRQQISAVAGFPLILRVSPDTTCRAFCQRDDLAVLAREGPATAGDTALIRRLPLIGRDVDAYRSALDEAFAEHIAADIGSVPDAAPRIVLDSALGASALGRTAGEAEMAERVLRRTIDTMVRATALEQYRSLTPTAGYEAEGASPYLHPATGTSADQPFIGEVALVTGGASGIGKACVDSLLARGAAVVSLDINPAVQTLYSQPAYLGIQCDLTAEAAIVRAFEQMVQTFGGLDMLVLNAGIFPAGCRIESLSLTEWQKVMRINLDSNVVVMREAYPLLKCSPRSGRVLVNASKNVLAPGVGAAAYSSAKAAVTQLGRIAALEWGKDHIRVNMIHPDAIFDTGIWTEDVLQARAKHYGMTVQQYKTRNVLGVELNSHYVGELAAEMLGPRFEKITGAQIPVDGGSDRVI